MRWLTETSVFPVRAGNGEDPGLFFSFPSLVQNSAFIRSRVVLLVCSDLCRQQGVARLSLSRRGEEAPPALLGLPESRVINQDPLDHTKMERRPWGLVLGIRTLNSAGFVPACMPFRDWSWACCKQELPNSPGETASGKLRAAPPQCHEISLLVSPIWAPSNNGEVTAGSPVLWSQMASICSWLRELGQITEPLDAQSSLSLKWG